MMTIMTTSKRSIVSVSSGDEDKMKTMMTMMMLTDETDEHDCTLLMVKKVVLATVELKMKTTTITKRKEQEHYEC